MPKIIGIDIPGKKRVEYSLRYIYGVGLSRAQAIVRQAQIDPAKRADALTGEELTRITNLLQDGYVLEGDLRREVAQNIRRLISIGSYRGVRHRKGLPVRGQRTHTNARTRKGVRKTVGVVRGKEARAAVKSEAPAEAKAKTAAAPVKAAAAPAKAEPKAKVEPKAKAEAKT
ncbi:MAG: 30S ribosomal protein S13 [Lentisphaerae bacterium]|nr:30S ribosomal protein S13 [Lentisphaerota bacterium]